MAENKKPVAIVLGGTNPHKALVENVQARGYYTILLDYSPNPPAASVADEHIQESTLDKEKVLEIARERKADLVIATCIDQANVTACYVAEKCNLPHPYSYETARLIADKIEMKHKLKDCNISTSSFTIIKHGEQKKVSTLLKYPIVVKPVDTGGSKGVRKVTQESELNGALQKALEASQKKEVLAEEYVPGINVDAVCLVANGRAHVLILRERVGIKGEDEAVLQYFHSIIPARISSAAKENIKSIAQFIADGFALENTPIQLQLIVTGDIAYVIEFAPRVGGGLSYKTVELIHGISLIDASVDSYFGNIATPEYGDTSWVYSENNIYAKSCTFDKLTGLQELIKNGDIEAGFSYKTQGDYVGPYMTSRDRIGSFIVKSVEVSTLREKVATAISKIKVLDVSGDDVTNRNIYEHIDQA